MKKLIRVFLDEGVPVGVGKEFEAAGHEAVYFKDAISTGSPDELVAAAAIANGCILIACDNDMKAFAKKVGVSNSRFRGLSLINIRIKSKVSAALRIRQAIKLIELEWNFSSAKKARRLHIEIRDNTITTYR